MTNLESVLKSRDSTLLTKVHRVKVMVFPVVMCRCESWAVKKVECQRIDAFILLCWRRLLRVPWTTRRSTPSILKGTQCWIFIGRADAEAPIICPPNAKSGSVGKDPDAGKDRRQEEMVGWHHWLNGHGFEKALWDGEGQGSLPCCSPQSHKESDMT